MNKLIIVEGPDECGKTTLAQRLARYKKGVYIHSTASKGLFSILPEYHRTILDTATANLALGSDVILDRFWPSEMAYGVRLLRPDSKYEEFADWMHEQIKKEQYLYIFCYSPTAWSRYEKGHTDPAHSLTCEQYRKVWNNYVDIETTLKKLECNVLQHIWDYQGVGEIEFGEFLQKVDQALA